MRKNRFAALLLAGALAAGMAGCGAQPQEESPGVAVSPSAQPELEAGKVAVLYYDFEDAYLSNVRQALDVSLEDAGLTYQDYDCANDQQTQDQAVDTALADGCSILAVNLVSSGDQQAAQAILDRAAAAGARVIFFNRPVEEMDQEGALLGAEAYRDMVAFVGTDAPQAGHLQGQMIGSYLLNHYDEVDRNGDGIITYALLQGEDDNAEAVYRTQYSVEDANLLLTQGGRPELIYFDPEGTHSFQVDESGAWSAEAAQAYMTDNLAEFNEAKGNMIELVICNNDEMAQGAITALQAAGYNTGDIGGKTIPVFGVDATPTAQALIAQGMMTGTIKQDHEAMAAAICQLAQASAGGAGRADAAASLVAGDSTYSLAEGLDNKIYVAYATFTVR